MRPLDPASFCIARGSLPVKSMYVSRPFRGRDFVPSSKEHWLVYLTWTTLSLASGPKADNRCNPTWLQPTTPIISLNDVKCSEEQCVRQDEKEQKVLSDRVGKWWSLTDSNR